MVSALFKACAAGDIHAVHDALSNATAVDVEIKDHTGSTPLIEAVRNGHFQVVKALLEKGADPTNASSQGLPETYTADPAILDLLNAARGERSVDAVAYDTNNDPNTYPQPPANYPFYPSINSAPPPDMYYQPPPMQVDNGASRHNNLPPPEVASAIPCRYFPACRYGAACLFQHPQGPYFQGPLPPPAQYPSSYEQPYAPTYYPVSPPSFPPPPPPPQGMPEMMPMPPPFSPNGAPYGPMSPMMYPQMGQAPIPIALPPLPPPPQPVPQSPQAAFNPSSPPAVPPAAFVMPSPQYPPNGVVNYPEANPASPQLNPQPDASMTGREGLGSIRRGAARRGSFANRKQAPPCIFFPTGRCKNGSECRFPHVMPPEGTVGHIPFYPTRGGAPRPQRNGFTVIDEKLANLSLQENGRNGVHEPATRGGRGGKANMNQGTKRAMVKQRVPNADEFPVLGGSTTPPARSPVINGNGHAGPTAAQILQAPRPVRSNSSQAITPARGLTPERVKELKPEPTTLMNGVSSPKIPISFAAVATAGADVSVAA
ncbi:hypothetical protein FB45DRAFT_559949 [Roridomyces roridus]|uniref:C3H1-type domain-containing protein n=1 Tax=Roridomyces roridus TaxID=1738132 RepID=A0AAD7BUW7_9AGAR|nr:hypothetical protein FB45DRAFT_559949 [Roridomyces roridus]